MSQEPGMSIFLIGKGSSSIRKTEMEIQISFCMMKKGD